MEHAEIAPLTKPNLKIAACLSFVILLLAIDRGFAQNISQATELKRLSLEQLLEMEVTTAARKPQHRSAAIGAIEVLTAERIRRSGATNFADVLRLAAGLNVVRSDGRSWGISARGFNSNISNKMQVLMDGRILHTPLFSGVFWDVQDYVLHDVERIEVIRGPGATLWGGNAVNGVINILTLPAEETQGTVFEGGGGNEETAFGSIRHGGQIGQSGFYRGYIKVFDRDGLVLANGQDAEDDWWMGRGGFRFDRAMSENSQLTVQGDVYRGDLSFADRDDGIVSGGNVIGRWSRSNHESSDLQLQFYYDRSDRKIPLQFEEERNTWNIDLQHRYNKLVRHDFIWGLNYNASLDQTGDIGTTQFSPQDRTIHHFSGFFQDDISIVPNRFILVLGAKLEDNTFSNLEFQPNVRFAWMPDSKQTMWAAAARAVRVPSRLDTDFRFFSDSWRSRDSWESRF